MPNLSGALVGYNFELSAGPLRLRAAKVRNVARALELEEVREGGRNDGVRLLVKSAPGAGRLELERCLLEGEAEAGALLGRRQTEPLLLCLYDSAHRAVLRTYRVEGWMVSKWGLEELDAVSGGLLLETMEIAYERLTGGGRAT